MGKRLRLALVVVAFAIVLDVAFAFLRSRYAAAQRSRQLQTAHAMSELSNALDEFGAIHGRYPVVEGRTFESVVAGLRRIYDGPLSATDGWGHPLVLRVAGPDYSLISYGSDGEAGPSTIGFAADWILTNGQWRATPQDLGFTVLPTWDDTGISSKAPWLRDGASHAEASRIFAMGRWYECKSCHPGA